MKDRFSAAVKLANTFNAGPPRPEWFWVHRAFEPDLDLRLLSEIAMKEHAKTAPWLKHEFRLAEPGESKDKTAYFYKQSVPKILAKRTLVSSVEDAMLIMSFSTFCSSERQDTNAQIFDHFSGLMKVHSKKLGFPEGGDLSLLVNLRDRRCLSASQYKRFAAPKAKMLEKALPKFTPAELVQAVYYIMHGGYSHLLTEKDIELVARGQGPDGNWGPVEKQVAYITPLYGAYIWAYILRQGGKPVSTEDYRSAISVPLQPAMTSGAVVR